MDADEAATPLLLGQTAKMVGIIAAFSIALQVAVRANRRAAELEDCIEGARHGARADLGNFASKHGFEGVDTALRDFERMLPGSTLAPVARDAIVKAPKDPIDGIHSMVGTIAALEVVLEMVVETNTRAARLHDRLEAIREAAISQVIGEDVLDDVFEGIDYAVDEFEDMLPPAAAL